MCPPYPQRDRKRRLNGAVCQNHRIKRVVPCWCRTGTLKKPTKCLWRWEPDRRSNFFSPPAHICAVTYITDISLIVTLNNQFTYLPAHHHSAPVVSGNFLVKRKSASPSSYWAIVKLGDDLTIVTQSALTSVCHSTMSNWCLRFIPTPACCWHRCSV